NGADVDAHAAFFALEVVILIRRNDGAHTAVLNSQRPNVHAFAADTHASITKDATRAIEEHNRRPLLFVLVILGLHELGLGRPIGKCHVLELALAPRVAHPTV